MEMKLLDSFGSIDDNFAFLNADEYAYSAGSRIVVRPFKTSDIKENRYLDSEISSFSKFCYNPVTHDFVTCELTFNTVLHVKLFTYEREKGGFIQHAETSISNCTDVSYMDISRDGTRVLILLPEPNLCMKILEINKTPDYTIKEVLQVPIELTDYKKCKFNPMNKNFIFLLSPRLGSLVEIIDSFEEHYQIEPEKNQLEDFENKEEAKITRRHEVFHINGPEFMDEYEDFTWDRYNKIYISDTSGTLRLIDPIKNMQVQRDNGEMGEFIEPEYVDFKEDKITITSMELTQRYLVCAETNGNIELVNMYMPDKEIKDFKSTLGTSYQKLVIDKEMEVPKLTQDEDYIVSMKYEQEYKKILAKTKKNNLYVLFLKGELLERVSDDKNEAEEGREVDNYEELKFHEGTILGVRELGRTTEILTISKEDQRVIFTDFAKKEVTASHVLEFVPTVFEVDNDGSLLFIASEEGVFRIYDITHRTSLRLVYQMKFEYKTSGHINRILVHPLLKYVIFYETGDRYLYFLSGEVTKKFAFLGYIKVPTKILDVMYNNPHGEDFSTDPVTIANVLVLVKGILLQYNVTSFFYDNKVCWEIKNEKIDDVFSKFELKVEPKAKKVDGDLNYILRNKTKELMKQVWLTGKDKMFRIFSLPAEKLDSVKESKKPIETPEEIKAHDLQVVEASIYPDGIIVSAGKDGSIQVRKDKKLIKKFRSHSFANGGISSFCFNQKTGLLFTAGYDGSVVILGLEEDTVIPESNTQVELASQIVETIETVSFLTDSMCPNFVYFVSDQHQNLIKNTKRQNQAELKARYDEIRNEQSKLFLENAKLEEHEQLKEKDMIIDEDRIKKEYDKNEEIAVNLTKTRFKELCEMEMQKKVLFDSTYDQMRIKTEDKIINNNIRIVYNSNGERELKTYALPNESPKFKRYLHFIKQSRLIQKMEEYKRRNEKTEEIINEKRISSCVEQYIINRFNVRPTIIEKEISLFGEQQNEGEKNQTVVEDKTRNNVAKYRLQRNPYEELNKKGDGEGGDSGMNGPEEQIYKDDLQMEYRTVVETIDPPDLEFKNINEIDSFSLLYSPFELYTNARIRNQIYLLQDVIHNFKKSFNAEYFVYIKERNQILEKFNTNKIAIEAIKEILPDVPIKNYIYAVNPHEDNEWVEKFDEKEVTVPRYYSKEEKKRMEEEKKAEEERLKALQGDTMQMRGLSAMISNKVKTKKDAADENELVREPWMNKKKEDMTDEQLKLFLEFQKKEMEIREQKEKIRSQNLTKLNFHKSEIENNQIDLDMKFAKILRRKLHYDTIISEQEIYILSLMSLLQKRENIKKTKKLYEKQLKEAEAAELKSTKEKEEFSKCYEKLLQYIPPEDKEREKAHFGKEEEKPEDNEFLKYVQNDPYYFYEKERIDRVSKFGNKEYKELPTSLISTNVKNYNQLLGDMKYFNEKYYFEYKKKQFDKHKNFLETEYAINTDRANQLRDIFKDINNSIEKLRLNYSLMIKLKRGQDEVTDDQYMELTTKASEKPATEGEENSQNESVENEDENNEILGEVNPNEQQEQEMPEVQDKYTLGIPVENSVLVDSSNIDELNVELQTDYDKKMYAEKTNKDHTQMMQYIKLENTLMQVLTMDIILKSKYLKLTRVTKKIQEVVTGKEEINQQQIAKLYEDKKRNLEENTSKRMATLDKKYKEINADIKKKLEENTTFTYKLTKLNEDVENTKQIIQLDDQFDTGDGDDRRRGVANKSEEIAEVSKLKTIVKNYYEEIEYLRAELDKLRARTFPSFLQKPDNVIYPDEK